MNKRFAQNQVLVQTDDSNCITACFENPDALYEAGYLIMQNQPDLRLVRCARSLQNGKYSLFYDTTKLSTLEQALMNMPTHVIRALLIDACEAYCGIRENGFLQIQHILTDLDGIYVERALQRVLFIYIPIYSQIETEQPGGFEAQFFINIANVISERHDISDGLLRSLLPLLRSGTCSLELIRDHLMGPTGPADPPPRSSITLVSVSAEQNLRFYIESDSFILGRQAETVDGYIPSDPFIGRKHGRIFRSGEAFFIEDLSSRNGTFVNDERILPGNSQRIVPGDQIRLGSLVFQVEA